VSTPPARPKIYHITHVDNLPGIVEAGGLLSDSRMPRVGGPTSVIGMSSIKERRLGLPVASYPGRTVGEFVPFYFCPRSIMLYVISRQNHPDLNYRGGQGPILHLQADLQEVVEWANEAEVAWAYSLSNAGAAYAPFRNRIADLGDIDWEAVEATDFRDADVKEGKQAEFLVDGFFPLDLVEFIAAHSPAVVAQVRSAIPTSIIRPSVAVRRDWYY
jgi:hypothetical protein